MNANNYKHVISMINCQPYANLSAAIEGLHGKNMGGRDLTVNIAPPMEARPPRTGGFGGGFGGNRRSY